MNDKGEADAARLTADGDACRLDVRAQPGAKRSGVVGVWNAHLKVAVRAPAQDGRANDELVRVLARALGLKPRDVELLHGERAQLKQVRIDAPRSVVEARLRELLAANPDSSDNTPPA